MNIRKFFAGQRDPDGSDQPDKKSAAIEALLRDFPWLWAIDPEPSWATSELIRVSQDMTDLKLVLTRSSQETSYVLWHISSRSPTAFYMQAQCVPRAADASIWADTVVRHVGHDVSILYLVVVDPLGMTHRARRITIFRHPDKRPLNEVVEQVSELQGRRTESHVQPGA